MKILVNSRQMKQCDKNTIERFGVPSLVLMERAALSTAEEIDRYFQVNQGQGTVLSPAKKTDRFFQVSQQQGTALTTVEEPGRQLCKNHRKKLSVLAVCGFGNNGGDGLAIGRLLWQRGYEVTIVMPSESGKLSEETKIQKEILCNYGLEITDSMPEGEFDVVIDALFGIGLTRNLEGAYQEYITEMNEKSGRYSFRHPCRYRGSDGRWVSGRCDSNLCICQAWAFAVSRRGICRESSGKGYWN